MWVLNIKVNRILDVYVWLDCVLCKWFILYENGCWNDKNCMNMMSQIWDAIIEIRGN